MFNHGGWERVATNDNLSTTSSSGRGVFVANNTNNTNNTNTNTNTSNFTSSATSRMISTALMNNNTDNTTTTTDDSTTTSTTTTNELTERLIDYPKPIPTSNRTVVVPATTYIQVQAPATLPEGYEFITTTDNGRTLYKVQVPPGGIEQGQVFSVPIVATTSAATISPPPPPMTTPPPPPRSNGTSSSSSSSSSSIIQQQQQPLPFSGVAIPIQSATAVTAGAIIVNNNNTNVSIPVGQWRDDICGCFNYGVCHPHVWTSFCCTLLAVGQVISRLQLTWYGTPARTANEARNAFTILFIITVVHIIAIIILQITVLTLDPNDYSKPEPSYGYIPLPSLEESVLHMYTILKYFYIIISAVWIYKVRQILQQRYAIPRSEPRIIDCCLSTFCQCCTVGQMLRHTTDYNIYPAQLCTSTGLPIISYTTTTTTNNNKPTSSSSSTVSTIV